MPEAESAVASATGDATDRADGGRAEAEVDGTHRPRLGLTLYGIVLLAAVSIQPFAGFVVANPQYPLPLGELLPYALVVLLLAVAVWLAIARWRPGVSSDVIASCVAAGVFAFFKADLVLNQYPRGIIRWVQPVVWLLVAALVVFLVFRLTQAPAVRTFLVLFASIWALISVVNAVALGGASAGTGGDDLVQADIEFVPITGDKPNVYWFVFDEYARNDQLEKFTGYDNGDFYDELRARGFQVSETSRANYPRTHMSMSSTLAMDYILQRGNQVEAEFRTLGEPFAGDNVTVERFRRHGYQYLFSDQAMLPWAQCQDDLADHCLPAASSGLDDSQIALLKLTPLGGLPFDQPHTDPVDTLEQLEAIDVDEPYFLFAHFNAPHFPYRFGPDCTFRSEPIASAPLDVVQWADYYRQEVQCTNESILDALDRLIAEDPTAVIVLQSDHGSASTVDWSADPDTWTAETLEERFSVLNAMRLPEECEHDIEGEPLVNTFRIVFSCLEGHQIETLDYRAYLAPWDDIAQIDAIDLSRFEGP